MLISILISSKLPDKNEVMQNFQCASINIYKLEDISLQTHSKRILLEHQLRSGDTIVFHKEAYMLKGQDTYDTFINKGDKWYQIKEGYAYKFFDSDSIQLNKTTDTINNFKRMQGFSLTYNNCFTYKLLRNLGDNKYMFARKFKLRGQKNNDTLLFNSNFGFYKEIGHDYDYGIMTTTQLIRTISCEKPDSYIKQQADSISRSFTK